MLNANSISLRLAKLDECIARLKEQQNISLDEYRANPVVQGSVERCFQVAIECCTDIASHLLSGYRLKRPARRRDVFKVLAEAGYLDTEYAEVMARMVQLRNRLVHLYWDVDPERMYQYLQEDVVYLERFRAFTLAVMEKERKKRHGTA